MAKHETDWSIEFDRGKFSDAFASAAAVAPARSPNVVLQHILIEAEPAATFLAASNTDMSVRCNVDGVTASAPGKALLPVERMGAILRECSDSSMKLSVSGSHIRVSGKSAKFDLQTIDPDKFPGMSGAIGDKYFELPVECFRDISRKTLFAVDLNGTRYALGGVKLEPDGDVLRAVSSDGRRLAVAETRGVQHGGEFSPAIWGVCIMPVKAMQMIDKIFGHLPGPDLIRIAPSDNKVMVAGGKSLFETRLLEGRFPVWQNVIPQRNPDQFASVIAGPLLSAIRQAAIVSSNESRGVDVAFKGNSVRITSRTAEVGSVEIDLPVTGSLSGVHIGFDNRYMQDFLRVLAPETLVQMSVVSATESAFCTAGTGYQYVLMPLTQE